VDAATLATITGSSTQLDGGNDNLALDSTGTIYAANRNTSSILEFAANPSGTLNEAPVNTIAGVNTGVSGPTSVAAMRGVYAGALKRRR
jgi:hypothetical protein